MLARSECTTPGRLLRGGPVFLGLSLSGLLRVLCASALSSLVLPVFAAQSSTASTPSHPATKNKKKSSPSKTHRQLAPEPARIVEIQQALAREGFYQGEPTGKWDDSTVTAMKNFQQAKGLQPTGKIEALSLQKLGLGSPVAGLAPPTPPSQPSAVPPQSDSQKKP